MFTAYICIGVAFTVFTFWSADGCKRRNEQIEHAEYIFEHPLSAALLSTFGWPYFAVKLFVD
jgi:hypothetical protein